MRCDRTCTAKQQGMHLHFAVQDSTAQHRAAGVHAAIDAMRHRAAQHRHITTHVALKAYSLLFLDHSSILEHSMPGHSAASDHSRDLLVATCNALSVRT